MVSGWQQQFGKRGFMNFNLGIGTAHQSEGLEDVSFTFDERLELDPISSMKSWKGYVNYEVTFGITIGKAVSTQAKDCDVLQYFNKEKSVWKFDLLNIVDNITKESLTGKLTVEYEQKIWKTPFSLNADLSWHYNFHKENSNTFFIPTIEARYYYNLKNRIRKAKTGNNFSADYIGAYVTRNNPTTHSYGPQWGIQRRIFGKLYVDYKIRYNLWSTEIEGLDPHFANEVKIGFAL